MYGDDVFRKARGLSLLECLVATLIASLALASLLPAVRGAITRTGQDSQLRMATEIARARLEWLSGMSGPLPLPASGNQGGLLWEWTEENAPHPTSPNTDESTGPLLKTVVIRVREGADRAPLVELRAERLVFAP
ncbi:MAG: hypothetical protein RIR70_943 [Pseudomonadota bacterium]